MKSFRLALSIVSLAAVVGCGEDQASGIAGPDAGSLGGTGASGGSTGGSSAGGTGSSAGSSTGGSGASGGTGGAPDAGADAQPPETCTGIDCGLCGKCSVIAGKATCECPTGYAVTGGKCALASDPCATASCAADEACVPEAHCQPLGACVKKCDCSNCGNCGPDNSDGKWDDWQEYCGNLKSSPATMACTTPCPSGQGCLPYNPPICWPMEGCLSL